MSPRLPHTVLPALIRHSVCPGTPSVSRLGRTARFGAILRSTFGVSAVPSRARQVCTWRRPPMSETSSPPSRLRPASKPVSALGWPTRCQNTKRCPGLQRRSLKRPAASWMLLSLAAVELLWPVCSGCVPVHPLLGLGTVHHCALELAQVAPDCEQDAHINLWSL